MSFGGILSPEDLEETKWNVARDGPLDTNDCQHWCEGNGGRSLYLGTEAEGCDLWILAT